MLSFMRSAPPLPLIRDQAEIDASYRHWRLHILLTMYLGYAVFYFTRKSFNFAMPDMLADGMLDKSDIGILWTLFYITYGCSKFFSGIISDRANPRYFMGLGLMIGLSFLSREQARRLGILVGAVMLALLFVVPLIGEEKNGARRWINVGMSLQPSEFLKPGFAIICAWILSWRLRDPALPVIWYVSGLMGLTSGVFDRSDSTRVVLLFEIWRPEISSEEQAALTTIFETINDYQGMPEDAR